MSNPKVHRRTIDIGVHTLSSLRANPYSVSFWRWAPGKPVDLLGSRHVLTPTTSSIRRLFRVLDEARTTPSEVTLLSTPGDDFPYMELSYDHLENVR